VPQVAGKTQTGPFSAQAAPSLAAARQVPSAWQVALAPQTITEPSGLSRQAVPVTAWMHWPRAVLHAAPCDRSQSSLVRQGAPAAPRVVQVPAALQVSDGRQGVDELQAAPGPTGAAQSWASVQTSP
jgi:hypothetical protein